MHMRRLMAWSMPLAVIVWAGQVTAGWVIQETVRGAQTHHQETTIQMNRWKTVLMGDDGKPNTAMILDLEAQTVTFVDYGEGQYMNSTIQEFVQTLQRMMGRMGEVMQHMQEAMKDLPPEQRKRMEEMVRSQTSQACREPHIELRNAGQQATIAGYAAVRYDVLSDGKPASEIWIAKGIAVGQELDQLKLERLAAEMSQVAGCRATSGRGSISGGGQSWPAIDPSWKLVKEGYPVRIVNRSGDGAIVEVIKADSRSVPATEFQPPPGFTRKSFESLMR